ncbi:MAG TPA: FecR domain-containing protein [Dyadobacter sp.]|nr:FecR domain-containing protein [Dyadobacter sp.]
MMKDNNDKKPDFSGIEQHLDQPFSDEEKRLILSWNAKQLAADSNILDDPERMRGIGDEMMASIARRTVAANVISLKRVPASNWLSVAACLLLVAGIGIFFKFSNRYRAQWTTFKNTSGSVQKMVLADRSQIWLNRNAVVSFPKEFSKDQRDFKLVEGEVFFDIAKNPERPFLINAGTFNVRVVGTSFNIRASKRSEYARLTVASGAVMVKTAAASSRILRRDDQVVINNRSGQLAARQVDAGEAVGWMSGEIYLEDVTFEEMINILQDAYAVTIRYPDRLKTQNASLNFSADQRLTAILEIISKIYNVQFEVKNGKEVILR